jgi:hypothetical protein
MEESISNEWDFFISHDSRDKDTFVRSLAIALAERGLKVWRPLDKPKSMTRGCLNVFCCAARRGCHRRGERLTMAATSGNEHDY